MVKPTLIKLIPVVVAVMVTSGTIGYLVMDNNSTPPNSGNDSVHSADIPDPVKTPNQSQSLDVTQNSAAVIEPSETPTPPAPTDDTTTPAIKWTDEMTAAGIADADQTCVYAMLLDDSGWRITGAHLWQKYNAPFGGDGSLTAHIAFAKRWVDEYYGGNWQLAYRQWLANGNF